MNRRINYYFLITVIFLVVFGFLFLSALSAIASLRTFGNTNYYLFHQLFALFIGLVAGLVLYKIPLSFLKKASPFLLAANILLLVVVFLPGMGSKFGGAQRWISIGGASFQPSEFLKITAVLYLSAWLSNKFSEHSKKSWMSLAKKGYDNLIKVYVPFLCLLGIIAITLYFQKDASTLGIISISLLVVYFAAGTPLWHTMVSVAGGISAGIMLIIVEPYRVQRFLVFLHPETDPLGIGFHIRQSLMAIGSGGIFGKGLGMSTQKFGFLPEAMSDSVFSILGEETGIIGTSILILLFIVFLWQSLKIANATSDKFSRLTAIGIATWIVTQAFMNIASNIGVFPVSGIPLPFFSYGGSHIISELIGVGILLNISKNG